MRIDKLEIEHYRNITQVNFQPGPGSNIIYGDNAQGKTNLLEAIWLFSGAKSFRGSREQELVQWGEEYARLHLEFWGEERQQTADMTLGREKKKILLNEVKQNRASALSGHFCTVVFSPDQLSMVKGGPDGRRRFLDVSLAQILPKYSGIMDSYERILRQRAQLLRDSVRQTSLLDMLEIWDEHLVRYGAYITATRAKYSTRLLEVAKEIYQGIASGKEQLQLEYRRAGITEQALPDREQCAEQLRQALKNSLQEDLRQGSTTVGPHRDDLYIGVDGRSARSYASQGQQRSCVLALKLAECQLMGQSVGEPPVVLLDDVMSELDETRREYLLNHLTGQQVFITCCDVSAFQGLEDGRIFCLRGGALV